MLKSGEVSHGLFLGPSVRVQSRNKNPEQKDLNIRLLARYGGLEKQIGNTEVSHK